MFYSAQTGGFYDAAIHGENIPAGAVEITAEDHAALLEGQSQGKRITPDAEGRPVLQDPPPASLDDLKAGKLAEVNLEAQKIANQLTAGYPEFEKATWPDQQAEVLAWNANSAVATPCLDKLAEYRGIDRLVYIQKTLAKVQAFRAAGWYLAGTRQKYEDAIKDANTPAKVAAIVPVFTLPD